MEDSLEYILACQICLEDFQEAGDHVPRLLPCTHSFCEKCLKQLMKPSNRGTIVECPECRERHRVKNGVRSFPQNKYVLANIRRKEAEILKNDQTPVNICEKHGKELSLYCQGPDCLQAICQTCLTRHHRGHDVVETEEIEKEALLEKMGTVVKSLEERKRKILETKEASDNKNKECIRKIYTRKEELIGVINQRFDQLLANVNHQLQGNDACNKLTMIAEHLDLLKNIKENMNEEVITHSEIKTNMETVASFEQIIQDRLSGNVEYRFFELRGDEPTLDVENLCGHLEESTRHVQLADEKKNEPYSWKGDDYIVN